MRDHRRRGPAARYVAASGVPMLSVEYRRAPEFPFPTLLEDRLCRAAPAARPLRRPGQAAAARQSRPRPTAANSSDHRGDRFRRAVRSP
ncbi:alpha/beta hydrolase fold domain-containing protein [Nonomuraea sp. NPDC004580]|uniref:alpha/beta hydrolase fold domain-containing protein n=1 Tax=Nonomuraea sp. NPDC004580 TaxID=3154552 RepID=UPI0033BB58AF